jgi:hypothetical protein
MNMPATTEVRAGLRKDVCCLEAGPAAPNGAPPAAHRQTLGSGRPKVPAQVLSAASLEGLALQRCKTGSITMLGDTCWRHPAGSLRAQLHAAAATAVAAAADGTAALPSTVGHRCWPELCLPPAAGCRLCHIHQPWCGPLAWQLASFSSWLPLWQVSFAGGTAAPHNVVIQ